MNTIKHHDLPKLLDSILEISQQAGKKILDIYDTNFSIINKKDNSPLTSADIAAHKIICKGLTKLNYDIPILSEESTHKDFNERKSWKQYWLIDPLDGTKGFINHNGEFSINIALIEDYRSIMGVIHIPVANETYSAILGLGAYKHKDNKIKIHTKKTNLENMLVSAGRFRVSEKLELLLNRFKNKTVLYLGSSLKFCLLADGKIDIYPCFGLTSEWDTAAAQCIVEEAGGSVLDIDFKPLSYNTKNSLLNSSFFVIADKSFNWRAFLT